MVTVDGHGKCEHSFILSLAIICYSECMLRLGVLRDLCCSVLFVMVPVNFTYLHLQFILNYRMFGVRVCLQLQRTVKSAYKEHRAMKMIKNMFFITV